MTRTNPRSPNHPAESLRGWASRLEDLALQRSAKGIRPPYADDNDAGPTGHRHAVNRMSLAGSYLLKEHLKPDQPNEARHLRSQGPLWKE